MLSISSVFSLREEQLHTGSDSSDSDYLDDIKDSQDVSIVDGRYYRERDTYEISGFYSDEDDDDPKPRSQAYLSSTQIEESACFADHVRFSVAGDVPSSTKAGPHTSRKRSFTNHFKARPESLAPLNSFTKNSSIPYSHADTTLTSSPFGDSPSTKQANRGETSDECFATHSRGCAPQISAARPNYLSQARRKLLKKAINRHIIVGFQPRATGLSIHEKNDCFQKIWIHQQTRIEAHQRLACTFELIPEEEES